MSTEIRGTKLSEMTEIINVDNEGYLMMLTNGENKKIKAKYLKGADNLSPMHVDLAANEDISYRLTVKKDGSLAIYNVDAYDDSKNAIASPGMYDGLIINQIYGGGATTSTGPISHSFIELYNDTKREINLKGMYLFYTNNGTWEKLPLIGIVPYQHSFLIRCNQAVEDINSDLVRCKINKYDQEWNISIPDNGFAIFLAVGEADPTSNDLIKERVVQNGQSTTTEKSSRFIDLMVGHGKDNNIVHPFTEESAQKILDKKTALRKIDFGFNSNTKRTFDYLSSLTAIDYSTCNVDIYKPRTISDGKWDYYINKLKLNENIPNLVNICYGENGNNTRTFTWQSKVTDEGYLKYKLESENKWKKIESKKEIVKHHDQDCTIHRVILNNLPTGIYEYQAGEEGFWSDIETFEIKDYTAEPIKVLWTTDQQGWTEEEYKAWKTSVEAIRDKEGTDFDFHLNTGDISQNASRSFEWRYYFKHSGEYTRNMPHVITCGNNDLIDKKYGTAFNYYLTAENAPKINEVLPEYQCTGVNADADIVSTYSFDLGCAHFVCVNSNEEQMYDGVSVNQFIAKQCKWLDDHLTEVKTRETQPRWIIVFMHLSPFTCVRTPRVQPFVPIFEKHKVDAVLCGHNHTYTRSKCLRTGFNGQPYKEMAANGGTGITYNRYTGLTQGVDSVTGLIPIEQEYKDFTNEELGIIDRAEDTVNGTYYIMNGATGYKVTGKETGITLLESLRGTEHSNIVDDAVNGIYPWWYGHWGGKMTQPMYITIEITQDSIIFKARRIDGVLVNDTISGRKIVNDYDSNTITINDELFDTLTINYQEARHITE